MKDIRAMLFNKYTIVNWLLIILSLIITVVFLWQTTYPYSCGIFSIQIIILPHLNTKILLSKIKSVSYHDRLSIGIFFGAITAFISTLPAFINTILSVLANIGNEHEIFSIWNSRGSHIPSEFGNYPIITFVGIFLIIFWIVTILIGAFCGYLAGSSKNRELIVLPNSKNHI